MGTELFNDAELNVKRFYGGDDRGVCYQFTTPSRGYVQLDLDQLRALVDALRYELESDVTTTLALEQNVRGEIDSLLRSGRLTDEEFREAFKWWIVKANDAYPGLSHRARMMLALSECCSELTARLLEPKKLETKKKD